MDTPTYAIVISRDSSLMGDFLAPLQIDRSKAVFIENSEAVKLGYNGLSTMKFRICDGKYESHEIF
jgi:hypothetical protein